MRPLLLPVLLFLFAAMPIAAQAPDAEALLADWHRNWRTAFTPVARIQARETAIRTVDGPGSMQRLRTVSTLQYAVGGPTDREILFAEINGRRVFVARLHQLETRLGRAYGAGYRRIRRTSVLPNTLIALVRPSGRITADQVDGVPVWEVPVEPLRVNDLIERGTLWFSRPGPGEAPRLLRSRIVGTPGPDSAVMTTDYTRTAGLDLPRYIETEVVVRQRRRRRLFTILLSAEVTLGEYTITPR
ncbi:MAG: hypothetical protein HKN04_15050 [Rhodothermaceae bacterium]|nr:hypothetical protein [Rhodothermaceae bacterium]